MPEPFNSTDPLAWKWTEKAYVLLEKGHLNAEVISKGRVRVARVDGKCPYCDDEIHVEQALTAVMEGVDGVLGFPRAGGEPPRPRYDEVTVTCGCSKAHEGDPNKGTGCGTSFRVAVLVET